MEEDMIAFEILTGKPIETKPLGRPRHRWEDDIRIYLNKIGVHTKNLIDPLRIFITGDPLSMQH